MIYIDYSECVPKKNMKFHGGANYGKRMINILANNGKKVTLLVPKGFKPETEMDKKIFGNKNVKLEYIDSLQSFRAEEDNALLYIPMIQTRRLTVIDSIKKHNPSMKVYVTIHGVRRLDLKPDRIDSYYTGASFSFLYMVKAWVKYVLYGLAYKYVFRIYIPEYDQLITVSNDSLQKIQVLCKPKAVKIYYEGSINSDLMMDKPVNTERENFALFVSGGREEKNLLRTLIGFQKFKEQNPSNNLKLIVTGVSAELRERLLSCPQLKWERVKKDIVIKQYVEDDELVHLYETCKYVIYMSKSEGFGLPLIEACMYGAPCLAASVTAMPEVLGSAIEYADPFDISSIAAGFERLENTDYKICQDKILRRRQVVIYNIKNADEDFLADFAGIE